MRHVCMHMLFHLVRVRMEGLKVAGGELWFRSTLDLVEVAEWLGGQESGH